MQCLFTSDLHGEPRKYERLFRTVAAERPDAVFLGGDLLPGGAAGAFLAESLAPALRALREELGTGFPRILLIMGNDDERAAEPGVHRMAGEGLLEYIHETRVPLGAFEAYGYAYVPPTPFPLKDWERYDVSRYVDPGHSIRSSR